MVYKNIKVLMVSSTSKLGGGPKHMFSLGEDLSNQFDIFYALPKDLNFSINQEIKSTFIQERTISMRDLYNLIKFMKKNNIQIIHAHGKGASVIGRILSILSRKPLIYTFHGIHVDCHGFLKKYLYLIFEFLTGRIDNKKVFVSSSEKQYAKKLNILIGKKNLIINNGVKNNVFKLNQKKDKFQKIAVVSVCRFVEQKNIIEILKIARILRNIDFHIIGDGPLFKKIKMISQKNKLSNLKLMGSLNHVIDHLYTTDIFLTCSLYEGLPLSVLEAMSIGLPIVASNVMGNIDTIEHSVSGFLYDLHDINAAAKFIKFLSEDYKIRTEMGKQAFKRQRNLFSLRKMTLSYEKIYKDTYEEE